MSNKNFHIHALPETVASSMQQKGIWKESCPISLKNLKFLEISHYDFAGERQEGRMVVLDKVAENVINIFKELYDKKFPIHKMLLIDEYNGDDLASMLDNNSSSFNYRNIAGTDLISMHSFGLAIDINPVQNPYITIDEKEMTALVEPKYGVSFLNRSNLREGMVEPIVYIFKKYGFDVWGGNWNSPIDYHHFQLDRKAVDGLLG